MDEEEEEEEEEGVVEGEEGEEGEGGETGWCNGIDLPGWHRATFIFTPGIPSLTVSAFHSVLLVVETK